MNKKRTIGLFLLLGLWALAAIAKSFYLAGPARPELMRKAYELAATEGEIPVHHGTIFDRNHIPLAWDESRLELHSTAEITESAREQLDRALGYRVAPPDDRQLILSDLSPDDVRALQRLIRSGFPVRIVARRERVYAATGVARQKLESWEKQYDEVLTGKPGRFRVLLDRFRNWIPESWRLIAEPVPGRDVTLTISLAELETP